MRYEDFEFLLCEPQDDGVMLWSRSTGPTP